MLQRLREVPQLPVLIVPERPDQSGWSREMNAATRIANDVSGGIAIIFAREAPDEVLRKVATAVTDEETHPAAAIDAFITQRQISQSPVEKGRRPFHTSWTL